MDSQTNLFLSLIELQGIVQLYNAYQDVEEDELINTKKLVKYRKIIENKANFLGLKEKLDKIMDNKIPYVKELRGNPLYLEFLRTNNTPIEHVYFKRWPIFLHSKEKHGTYNYY